MHHNSWLLCVATQHNRRLLCVARQSKKPAKKVKKLARYSVAKQFLYSTVHSKFSAVIFYGLVARETSTKAVVANTHTHTHTHTHRDINCYFSVMKYRKWCFVVNINAIQLFCTHGDGCQATVT